VLQYRCTFSCVQRRSPAPSRLAEAFHGALVVAHQAA
jgi:hypothetical protein